VPGDLYKEIALKAEREGKPAEQILYSTHHLPETVNLYYQDHHLYNFNAKIIDVFSNVLEGNKRNMLILDQSAIYPTSGG